MTRDLRSPDCLEPEAMAAYVDGGLDAAGRAAAERHLADCDDCYERFSDVAAVMNQRDAVLSAPAPVKRRHSTLTYLYLAAASVTLALLAGSLARSVGWWTGDTAGSSLNELLAATREHRAAVGRLSMAAQWAPAKSETRGTDSSEVPPAVAIAAAQIQQALDRDRSVHNLQAYATAQLVIGHAQNAVSALEEAVRIAPRDAAAWSDLSAACYARGDSPDGAVDLARGLEAANVAIGLDHRAQGPLFNRALLLERLNLRDQAVDAWKAYLAADSGSPWAEEARERLAQLRQRSSAAPTGDLQTIRDQLFDEVLGRWGSAILGGDDSAAAAALRDARKSVAALDASNDRFSRDVVAAIDRFQPKARRLAARGHVSYAEARIRYAHDDFDAAAPLFDRAANAFTASHSPAALIARLYAGIVRYRRRDGAGAIAEFRAICAAIEHEPYASIAGRARWTEGVALEAQGLSREAVIEDEQARSLLATAHENRNAAFVDAVLASHFDHVGDSGRAWQAMTAALAGTQREGALLTAAIMATSLQWHHVALEYEQAAVRVARTSGSAQNLADALRWQAITLARLGRISQAREAIADARLVASRNSGPSWQRIGAEIDGADAMAFDVASANTSLAAGTRAIAYFRDAGSMLRIPELLRARGVIYARTGDLDQASRDLREGLRIAAELRQQVESGFDQVTFGDTLHGLIAAFVDVEDRRGDLQDAFTLIDDARGVDIGTTPLSSQFSLADLVARIGTRTALAEFTIMEDRTVVWLVTRSGCTVIRLPAGMHTIAGLADAAGPPRFDQTAAVALRRLLFSDLEARTADGDLIVVVPDGPLYAVPLAALVEDDGTYFIERHPITIAPSARTFIDGSSRLRAYSQPPRQVFVAGNAKIDAARYPGLPALPFAEQEANAVAVMYPEHVCLTEDAVTRASVVGHLDDEVVHIAGHAVVNNERPLESEIVVWDPDGPGLRATAIRQLDCRRTRAIVLGACRTADGQTTSSEGAVGLARAFLEAGAPAVVASRWDIDDRAAAALLTRFHTAFTKTGDAPSALRDAQLSMTHSTDPDFRKPGNWAAFIAIGGTAMQ